MARLVIAAAGGFGRELAAYARDAGLRIDHLLLSPSIAGRLAGAGVYREVRGWDKASDHAPTWVELRDATPA